MLADGRNYLAQASWLGLLPGLSIAIVVMAAFITGDGLRKAPAPKGGRPGAKVGP